MQNRNLGMVVFTAGAAVMVLEIVGIRLLAPYLGSSFVVWTSMIGVVMASLSAGYMLGGWLADRSPGNSRLSTLMCGGALATGAACVIDGPVLRAVVDYIPNIYLRSVSACLILFAPASVLFGMVFPMAMKLRLRNLDGAGRTAGLMSTLSTIGALLGTFISGFFLLSWLGSTATLLALAAICALAAMLAAEGTGRALAIFTLLVIAAMFWVMDREKRQEQNAGRIDIDTRYVRIWVEDSIQPDSDRRIRTFKTDPCGVQAGVFIDGPEKNNPLQSLEIRLSPEKERFAYKYYRFFDLFRKLTDEDPRVLMIGGGAYVYPRYFLSEYPQSTIDVVEIDEELTAVAAGYFGFKPDRRMTVYNEDGRVFLGRNRQQYDVALIDAFNSACSVPFHLTTHEALRQVSRSLAPEGVLVVNTVSALDGPKGRFFRAFYATMRTVFPHTYVFAVNDPLDRNQLQNIFVVGLKSRNQLENGNAPPDFGELSGYMVTQPIAADLPILTDDYAPVDKYFAQP